MKDAACLSATQKIIHLTLPKTDGLKNLIVKESVLFWREIWDVKVESRGRLMSGNYYLFFFFFWLVPLKEQTNKFTRVCKIFVCEQKHGLKLLICFFFSHPARWVSRGKKGIVVLPG